MTVAFRNVDASPTDPVASWPYEALATTLERGLVADWRPVLAEIRRQPWGSTARRVEQLLGYEPLPGVRELFSHAIARARADQDRRDRDEVAARVRSAVGVSGLTAALFADLVGTSASRLSTYASGKVTPSAAMLLRIERAAAEPVASGGASKAVGSGS
jgi:hypothetical protein